MRYFFFVVKFCAFRVQILVTIGRCELGISWIVAGGNPSVKIKIKIKSTRANTVPVNKKFTFVGYILSMIYMATYPDKQLRTPTCSLRLRAMGFSVAISQTADCDVLKEARRS